jgi:hypothetical protein
MAQLPIPFFILSSDEEYVIYCIAIQIQIISGYILLLSHLIEALVIDKNSKRYKAEIMLFLTGARLMLNCTEK